MTDQDRIEDLEHQIYIAYAEGDYQQASQLEKALKNTRPFDATARASK